MTVSRKVGNIRAQPIVEFFSDKAFLHGICEAAQKCAYHPAGTTKHSAWAEKLHSFISLPFSLLFDDVKQVIDYSYEQLSRTDNYGKHLMEILERIRSMDDRAENTRKPASADQQHYLVDMSDIKCRISENTKLLEHIAGQMLDNNSRVRDIRNAVGYMHDDITSSMESEERRFSSYADAVKSTVVDDVEHLNRLILNIQHTVDDFKNKCDLLIDGTLKTDDATSAIKVQEEIMDAYNNIGQSLINERPRFSDLKFEFATGDAILEQIIDNITDSGLSDNTHKIKLNKYTVLEPHLRRAIRSGLPILSSRRRGEQVHIVETTEQAILKHRKFAKFFSPVNKKPGCLKTYCTSQGLTVKIYERVDHYRVVCDISKLLPNHVDDQTCVSNSNKYAFDKLGITYDLSKDRLYKTRVLAFNAPKVDSLESFKIHANKQMELYGLSRVVDFD